MCDKNHFGYRCEHHISSGQPLQSSACREMGLECSHLCSLVKEPHCLCPPHLVLHNTTHCIPRAQLVDVTVQLVESPHHFPLDQVKELLREACITMVNASYEDNSKEFHFAMNKYQRNCLPEKSQWEAVLKSSVNLSLPKQDFLWVGPLNKSVEEGNLVLKCTVYTSLLPVNVSFFIGQHQIFNSEIESCYGHYHDKVMTSWFEKDEDSIDTTCSYNNICTNNTICTITFKAEGYDPDLDWGKFSVEVSQGNTSTQQSVVVDGDPRLVVVVQPPSAAVNKSGNTTLICTLVGDWKWNEDCEIKWVFPVDSGVFEVETPAWNISYLYIKHLKRSITVTCEVAIWRFCDDRMNRSTSMCVGRGCKPQVVTVHCLDPETLFCPEQKDASQAWHITPVNAMSYSNCPEGFDGISKRLCELGQNDTAVWAEPDYYHCVYHPFSTLLQRPVMRYLKRGFHVAVDCNSTVMEMKHLFEARRSMLLPREHFFIQDQMKYLLRPNVTPVDIEVFLRFFQEIRKKMALNDTWQLMPLVRTYLSLVTSQRGSSTLDDLVLWVQDIPAEWEYSNREHNKRLHLEMAVPPEDRKSLHVGALVFLDPKSIPAGVVYGTDSREQVDSHKLTGPVVEIEVSTNDDLSFVTGGITLNMSYYDPDVTTERNVCGGAEVSGTLGETLKWDLTRCTVLNLGHRGRRVTRCHCQGPGVFAFIKMPELVPTDTN
uniref:Ig-like domain-containing protein n=1 Tax=Scylla olivacea TaxID=85551 RepID=A0A0P4W5U4_SCYOL